MASSNSLPPSSLDMPFTVDELIKETLLSIPEDYIRSDLEALTIIDSSFLPTIPTIDLKRLVSSETADFELEKLHSACKEWGFFQLVNHGVSSALLNKLKFGIEEFYKLPLKEKLKYKVRPGEPEGYGAIPRPNVKLDWGDRLYMTTNPTHRRKPHLIPEFPSSLRNILECYLSELQQLTKKLLGLLATALKMNVKEIEELFDDGFQSVRVTNYPPCPQPEMVMGLCPHSDATGITILKQLNGVDGLQIKKSGKWCPVSLLPDAFVVNVGDILEIVSNGEYKSIEHRVTVNSEKERISIAFFVNPKLDAIVGPATSLINPQNPPLYKKKEMENYIKDFFSRPLNGKSYLEHMKIEAIN